jgi:hypothetical protein
VDFVNAVLRVSLTLFYVINLELTEPLNNIRILLTVLGTAYVPDTLPPY